MGIVIDNDIAWMKIALGLSQQAVLQQEVPVGAIVVYENKIVGQGWNQPIQQCDPTAHAEIVALRRAAQQLGNYRLIDTTLYVTLEPCAMCIGAMLHARIRRLVFGATDPKAGAVESVFNLLNNKALNHYIEWKGGVLAFEGGKILKDFFQKKRNHSPCRLNVLPM
jgi:tRNA(adenine34) deaminase